MKTVNKFLALSFTVVLLAACTSQTTSEVKKPSMTIHEATFFGDTKAVQQHIDYGTDLNQKDDYGSTPLNIAITFGKTDIANMIIEGGADLSVTTADGSTPLHSAAFFGRTEIVKTLIDKSVDLTAMNSYGSTALQSAAAPFSDMIPIYDQISKDMGPFGLKLDYDKLESSRIEIAQLLETAIKSQKVN
jgi:hypothetical protein